MPWIVSDNANVTYLEPEHFVEYGSRRVQIKYGPYEVPGNHIRNGMETSADWDAAGPCNNCLITLIQADLIYPSGATANASTGLWLHHVNLGNQEKGDITGCSLDYELFFAAGNERAPADFCVNG